MKKNFLYLLLLLFVGFSVASCSDDDEEIAFHENSACLIVNQGNYTEKNSSLSYYNAANERITNTVFKMVNGRNLTALTESAATNGTLAVLVCNSPDKLEVINIRTAKTVTKTITSAQLVNPRYAVMTDKYAYVTCWGGRIIVDGWWDDAQTIARYTFPDSYIARVDLTTYTVTDTTACGNDVEGIVMANNKIYVAVSEGVEVFNVNDMSEAGSVKHTSLRGGAKHVNFDKNGKMWYSVSGKGFVSVNTSSMTVDREIPYTDAQSYFAMNKTKDKIVFFTNETGDNHNVIKSDIYLLNTDNQTVNANAIYEGTHLNGVGVDPGTGKIYTAEIFGYTVNSTLKIMDENGANIKEAQAGIATSRFVFY